MSNKQILYLHAAGACIAWAILMPIGAAVRKITTKARYHAIIQSCAYVLAILSFSAGIVISKRLNDRSDLVSAHQILGLVIFPVMLLQLPLGLYNHWSFKSTGSGTWTGSVHRNIGPALIVLGVLNAYLGIDLAEDDDYIKPYVVTVTVWFYVLFMATAVFRRYRRRGPRGIAQGPGNVVGASEEPMRRELSYDTGKDSVA